MYFWFQTMKANVKQQRSLRKSESEECGLFENCPNSELWFLKNVCDMWGYSLPSYFRLGYRVVNLFTQMKLLSISQDSYEVRSFAQGHIVLCNSHKSHFLFYSLKSLLTWDTKKKNQAGCNLPDRQKWEPLLRYFEFRVIHGGKVGCC